MKPRTNASAMASAASVKTLVSLKAFKSAPSLGYAGMRPRESLISPRRDDAAPRPGRAPPRPGSLQKPPLLRICGDAPTRLSYLPAPALPGSGSAGRLRTSRSFCPLSLAAPRLFVPLVYRSAALHATPRLPQQPDHRRRVRDAPVPDHRERLPEGHPHHPDKLRWL